jgi:hypothetical protein
VAELSTLRLKELYDVLAEGPLLDARSVEYLAERLAGAWLTVGGARVDLIYRDLDEVLRWTAA